ncbi:hypothetical protein E0H73_13170 [Kribbella pittospori]|uniref:Uncharacterized protein n=1 Tax=Kribbella pittospori TaxID=722689 RepID=A0A4R0KR98_9ACTN|nr:hypothetical protein [Kribbella pittospori]TCC63391.1 hypothetical protein E0H73_13170 [Kribbella pittospori]
MTAPHESHGPSYQVAVQGELKPAVLVFCAGPQAHHQTSGVFRLRVHDEQGIADLVAMLETAGLTILSIRQVSPTAAERVSA